MYMPLVSVIIPTYNRKELVKEAVQSVLEQDYPKIEVVIVDDGSTDGTKEELTRVFGSPLRYVFQGNGGESRARNKGVIESKGELVCFLDSDDILLPGSISSRVQCFRDNDKCQVSYGMYVNERNYERKKETILKHEYPSGYILKEYVNGLIIHNNTFMLSRMDMLNHGMYQEDLTNLEDYELFVRLTHKLYFCYCGALCAVLRDRGQRARHNFEEIIAQGTKELDYIFADPNLARVLAKEKARLYAETYLRLAKACLRLNRPREFRRYFKMARELQHSQRRNFKFGRRWLLSWLKSL
ncbi:MAG TPA: glycosyltransferase family A protein [Thermodesulfobacteriota bacterium]|jgi:glycosyltransferase involved in cell wall biosynthesis